MKKSIAFMLISTMTILLSCADNNISRIIGSENLTENQSLSQPSPGGIIDTNQINSTIGQVQAVIYTVNSLKNPTTEQLQEQLQKLLDEINNFFRSHKTK